MIFIINELNVWATNTYYYTTVNNLNTIEYKYKNAIIIPIFCIFTWKCKCVMKIIRQIIL